MKILLSHSWEDKSPATQLRHHMEADGHKVWLDVLELIEGDPIQKTIDSHIGQCDVMVLVWTKHALVSDGVDSEIKSAKKIGKRIIPVMIDNTPLHLKKELDGLLGVPAVQLEIGSLLLRRALLLLMIPEEYKSTTWFSKAFENVKDLGGYLKYVQTFRIPGNKNEDGYKEEWVKLLEQLSSDNEYIRQQLMPVAQADIDYLQNIINQVEKGNNTKEQLDEWLNWCKKNKNVNTPIVQKLVEFLEKDRERLQAGGSPVKALDTGILIQAIRRLQSVINDRKNNAEKNICDSLNKFTFGLLGPKTTATITKGLMNYVTQCPTILSQLLAEASLSEYVAVKEAVVTVGATLERQDHTLEAEKKNLDGYFDDAYLINNTAKLLIEAGLVAANKISLDFVSSHITDKYFSLLLPIAAKQKMDTVLTEVRTIIGLKKKEINWGMVAAVVVGGIIISNNISSITGVFIGDSSFEGNEGGGGGGGYFEDKVADFSAKYGGGLNAYTPVNYGN
jgi:TIR domain